MAVVCTCEVCGTEFTSKPSRATKYCSRQCMGIARRTHIECTCERCGKHFRVLPSDLKRGKKYCSLHCRNEGRKKDRAQLVCSQCGVSFFRPQSSHHQNSNSNYYCSLRCAGIARSLNRRGEKHHNWRGGTCNYRGENWVNQRRLAYIRDQGVCQHCGKKPCKGQRKNAVHHIKPYREFNGDYMAANQLTNLITLCHHCHYQAEYGKIAVQPYLF